MTPLPWLTQNRCRTNSKVSNQLPLKRLFKAQPPSSLLTNHNKIQSTVSSSACNTTTITTSKPTSPIASIAPTASFIRAPTLFSSIASSLSAKSSPSSVPFRKPAVPPVKASTVFTLPRTPTLCSVKLSASDDDYGSSELIDANVMVCLSPKFNIVTKSHLNDKSQQAKENEWASPSLVNRIQ